jgi:hypothetical protein
MERIASDFTMIGQRLRATLNVVMRVIHESRGSNQDRFVNIMGPYLHANKSANDARLEIAREANGIHFERGGLRMEKA